MVSNKQSRIIATMAVSNEKYINLTMNRVLANTFNEHLHSVLISIISTRNNDKLELTFVLLAQNLPFSFSFLLLKVGLTSCSV